MRKWSLILTALLLVCLSQSVFAQDGVLLQYKFDENKPLKYRLDMTTDATFTTPDGGVRKTSMVDHMELKQELIQKNPDGTFRIAITIEKATQTMDNNPVQVPIQPGHSILLTMKPNGQITEGASEFPAAQQQSQLQMVFPTEAVKDGTTWKHETEIQDPLPLKAVTNYVVTKVGADFPGYEGKCVQMKSTMGMDNEKTPTGEGVTSKTAGDIWFDAQRGRIVKSTATSDFTISIPINLQNVLPPNSVVKIDFKIDVKIALVL